MPHVWSTPSARDAKRSPPPTATGFVLSIVDPSPSCPCALNPQQYVAPSAVWAQLWYHPPTTLVNTKPAGAATGAAVRRVAVVPSPSWPKPFHPQQETAPGALSAHVCRPPDATFVNATAPAIGAAVLRATRVE